MLEGYYAILKGREKAKYLKSKENGIFDELLEKAWDMFHHCNLCEHRCNVDREKQKGICDVTKASIATHFMHYGEESFLVPSYTMFFSGCNFKCVYCQNWDISQRQAGLYIEPEKMAEYIEKAYERGAKNINWVGGEPTPNIPYILETLKNSNVNIPQIWNSNMYLTTEAMELL
ncbi:MAG: radical SAM protein, partial [Thermoplasmata archaeon]|nr:radical SAM protein [Thermoplasmata archaeon]